MDKSNYIFDPHPGERVLVNLGLGTFVGGRVEDRLYGSVGVVLDNSDGSIWRTTLGHVGPEHSV